MNGRLVWISAEMIANAYLGDVTGDDLIRAWDAAPADSAEAVRVAIRDSWFATKAPNDARQYAEVVLRALGVPEVTT